MLEAVGLDQTLQGAKQSSATKSRLTLLTAVTNSGCYIFRSRTNIDQIQKMSEPPASKTAQADFYLTKATSRCFLRNTLPCQQMLHMKQFYSPAEFLTATVSPTALLWRTPDVFVPYKADQLACSQGSRSSLPLGQP